MHEPLKIDQIVWGKIGGYPWWPGFIRSMPQIDRYEVVFFGDFSISLLKEKSIKKYDILKDKPKKYSKLLFAAMNTADRVIRGETTLLDEWTFVEEKNQKKIRKRSKSVKIEQPLNSIQEYNKSKETKQTVKKTNTKTNKETINNLKMLREETVVSKRLYSINNSNAETNFLEIDLEDNEIRYIENSLNNLFEGLSDQGNELETLKNQIKEITPLIVKLNPRQIFASKIGCTLRKCVEKCESINKTGKTGAFDLLDTLKQTKQLICTFIIEEGFLKDRIVFEDIISQSRKELSNNQSVNYNSLTPRESTQGLAIESPLALVPKNKQLKRKKERSLKISKQINFRVKKRLARLFMNYYDERCPKSLYEIMGIKLEAEIQKYALSFEIYKKIVISLVTMVKKRKFDLYVFKALQHEEYDSQIIKESIDKLMIV